MARYLNPQKISLLVLAKLYCEYPAPSSATIPILTFLTSQLIPEDAAGVGGAKHADACVLTLEHFEKILAAHPHRPPGDGPPEGRDETLYDAFLARLWCIDSLDALHSFFDALSELVGKPPRNFISASERHHPPPRISLSRTSPLGTFVRRAQLEFARLQFHDVSKLWLALVNYKLPTKDRWQERRRVLDGATLQETRKPWFDENLAGLGLEEQDGLFRVAYGQLDEMGKEEGLASMDEIEKLLAFQIDRLQKYGNRVPDDMRERLRKMLGPTATAPSLAHFVKFFDAWRAGDYTSSFDNLHRYFDYTMQTRDKTYYQYALLHMAILQADFGCFSEAIAAMNETIATARENQDMGCLNFSLSWLNHLAKAYPKQIRASGYGGMLGSERDGLAFLKSKAKETKMWSLLSSTLLSEAKMLLSSGSSVPRAFEHIYQSAHLNVVHNIRSNIGSQMLMQASLYGRLGATDLSDAVCDILYLCYGNVCPIEDTLRSTCHSAYIRSQAGDYTGAFEILDSINQADHRTLKFHQYISNYAALLKAKRALRRSDFTAATHLLDALRAFRPTDPEILYQLTALEVDALTRRGDFAAAFVRLDELAADLKAEDADIYQRVHLLTLKATLFAKAGVPEKGFSIAMRASSAAHRARLWPALWEALAAVQTILVELGEFRAARRLGDAVAPLALEAGDEALCAKLYLALADACVGIAGEEQQQLQYHHQQQQQREIAPSSTAINAATSTAATDGNSSTTSLSAADGGGTAAHQRTLTEAMLFLEKARNCFHAIEDVRGECETLAKRALLEKLRTAMAADDAAGVIPGGGALGLGQKDDSAAVEEAVAYIGRYKAVMEGDGAAVAETVG
ncbi:anaphase-promoting complex subunit 5 [Diplodia corticola]|uniref:Anaphase-promoting complex subunit 5 n=1 Tax=Diplodia corticola TaxID=236234 RepID=A0A1J9RBF5_9PEZI|nr:anaphase-promoting complex subunit 5 [Diplodia corticola]OJD37482.1 anaphase-promoting complex subunit 5 [Diplodia corticola]